MTQYVYGTTLAESGVARADLLRGIIYPDSDDTFSMTGAAPTLSDGADETYDRVEYTYNRAGRAVSTKDQNETVHDYIFDALGRLTDDCVTDLDASLDDAVLRISRTYEVRGMVESVTSWDDPDPGEGDEVNQVVYEFDDFGQLTREYQEHAGAKDANTPYVEYHYADGSDNHVRLEWVEYPNGRLVHYTYGATDGAADAALAARRDLRRRQRQPGRRACGVYVSRPRHDRHRGLSRAGREARPLRRHDRHLRRARSVWPRGRCRSGTTTGESTNVDQFTYGYDLAGNRLYRENTLTSGMDELYSYDAMNQLVNFQRGDLNVGKTALTGTIANEETFTLDATGNWSEYEQEVAGSTVLDQSRDHDEANQTGTITASTGTNWYDPTYDAVGNMTSIPKPSDPINGLTLTYDAWNRLVRVEDGEDVVAEYQYDGTARRIVRAIDTASPDDPDGTLDLWEHFFYSGQQVVETRDGDDAEDQPEALEPHYQYVYSPRYIDAAILRDENTDTDGTCDDGRIYYLADANYNVTTLIDEGGTVLERYTYTPYGEPTIYNGRLVIHPQRFDRGQLDPLHRPRVRRGHRPILLPRRWYDAGLGRFVGRDPLGYAGGGCESVSVCG